MYAKASAIEHPFLALIAVLVSTTFLLPPLAFAAFLGSPVLVPVALLLLVRSHGCPTSPDKGSIASCCKQVFLRAVPEAVHYTCEAESHTSRK